MGDLNEHSVSAGNNAEGGVQMGSSAPRKPIPEPVWRFRTTLKSSKMVQTLKTQIIPKIAIALGTAQKLSKKPAESGDALQRFVVMVLGSDDDAAWADVQMRIAQGTSVETIFLELLTPAARQLGEMWEADTTDFATVTLGVSRMQRIMRRLGEPFCDSAAAGIGAGSALLTILPGEQHSFGLSMVAEFFRRAGWSLSVGPFSSHQELMALVQDQWFDIVGFSITSDRRLDELKRDIDGVRRVSRNRNVGIMVGGPIMLDRPELAAILQADIVSVEATTAPQQAGALVELLKSRAAAGAAEPTRLPR
jgi:methanogenic corrinoid protein MtbC1